MHELFVCERVVDLMDRQLARVRPAPVGVACVRLVVGELHQIVESLMRDAYLSLTAGGLAAGSTLEIRRAPVVGECAACAWKGELEIPWLLCGSCGSHELDIVGGKELFLESIEIIEAEAG